MRNNSGFSLIELMVTIAVFGILSAIAIPNIISWRSGAAHLGAVNTLSGDLALAKQGAVRNNTNVIVSFAADGRGYEVFVDNNRNGGRDAGERLLRDRSLPSGVTAPAGVTIQFNSQGLCPAALGTGIDVAVNGSGQSSTINVNRLGRINVI